MYVMDLQIEHLERFLGETSIDQERREDQLPLCVRLIQPI